MAVRDDMPSSYNRSLAKSLFVVTAYCMIDTALKQEQALDDEEKSASSPWNHMTLPGVCRFIAYMQNDNLKNPGKTFDERMKSGELTHSGDENDPFSGDDDAYFAKFGHGRYTDDEYAAIEISVGNAMSSWHKKPEQSKLTLFINECRSDAESALRSLCDEHILILRAAEEKSANKAFLENMNPLITALFHSESLTCDKKCFDRMWDFACSSILAVERAYIQIPDVDDCEYDEDSLEDEYDECVPAESGGEAATEAE